MIQTLRRPAARLQRLAEGPPGLESQRIVRSDLRSVLILGGSILLIGGGVAAQERTAVPGNDPNPLAALQALVAQDAANRLSTSSSDDRALLDVLDAARTGGVARMRADMAGISDPLAKKIALWAFLDAKGEGLSFAELDAARRSLVGWPRGDRRDMAAEKMIEGGGVGPQGVIAWFAGSEPQTAEGAMALASAYQASGQGQKAADLIRAFWRTKAFDADVQQRMLMRFGAMLTADDHAAREDMLLFGAQGPGAYDLLPLLPPDQQALAQARMALRSGAADAADKVAAVPASLRSSSGLAFEQALDFQRRGEPSAALAALPSLSQPLSDPAAQDRMWKLRQALVVAALKWGDGRAAYHAAADSGVDSGQAGAEAEFYAGWLALSRLKDPRLADDHFARLQTLSASPITQARAFYWRGRAMEAAGDPLNAQLFYASAAKYPTTFYGQLAAARSGQTRLAIGGDPAITPADRAQFASQEPIHAARLLAEIGARETFKSFMVGLAQGAPDAQTAAQLVDLARSYGDQELSMRIVRIAAQHGFILPERGYPLRAAPQAEGGPEPAFVLGIVRQESGFDPHVRSPAGALGMMQLMPGTAQTVARKLGYSYGAGRLEEADYNMQLGSAYLGELVGQFGGSYLMAAAAYNAGPGRPLEWAEYCGDPRSSSTDPADFVECIPFSETRNYVMRVLEATEVYRARLAGGSAPLMLAQDLKRGGYSYAGAAASALNAAAGPLTSESDRP